MKRKVGRLVSCASRKYLSYLLSFTLNSSTADRITLATIFVRAQNTENSHAGQEKIAIIVALITILPYSARVRTRELNLRETFVTRRVDDEKTG